LSVYILSKNRFKNEGSQLVTKCDQMKLKFSDGKFYMTNVRCEANFYGSSWTFHSTNCPDKV